MAANILDKFTEATNGTRPDNAALTAQKSIGAASITVDSTAGWGTATAVHFVIYQIDAGGARVANTQTEWKGIVSSSTSITSLTLKAGTDQVYPVGSKVIATPTAAAWDDLVEGVLEFANQDGSLITQAVRDALGLTSGETSGWETLGYAPNTITALGNRSYTVVVNSVDLTATTSVGMRLKLPRTVTAPTGSITLNGTTQYANKTSPSGMTFIDDFTISAWIKLSAYTASGIASRHNGTTGFYLNLLATGQLIMRSQNGAGAKDTTSYQSIPLNKWVHVAGSQDVSGASYKMYIDGVEVPSSTTGTGTGITQAGDLQIGATTTLAVPSFSGQLAQVAIYSAVLTAATIRASMNQTLTGSETSLVSAYKLDQASGLTDLAATGNTLTAQGSPSYSTTQTPFTNSVTGTSVTAGTTNYGIIMAQTFSTNTTYTIQIPEGETLPTTGGIGTVSYSTQKTPYGFPGQRGKWQLITFGKATETTTYSNNTWTQINGQQISLPVGEWEVGFAVTWGVNVASGAIHQVTLSTASNSESDPSWTDYFNFRDTTSTSAYRHRNNGYLSLSASTSYYLVGNQADGLSRSMTANNSVITANNAYL